MRFTSLIAAVASASLASVASACQADGTIGNSLPASNLNCCSGCAWNSYISNNVVGHDAKRSPVGKCNSTGPHGSSPRGPSGGSQGGSNGGLSPGSYGAPGGGAYGGSNGGSSGGPSSGCQGGFSDSNGDGSKGFETGGQPSHVPVFISGAGE
ncbi:hypothetical protein NOF04DRAFT_6 [Fusarium oxysporum II5]|uniref:Uncharacterized protein n=1 Tax=Fusarium odoratissimum (strain NRRL 54006) TaxID=1089451 RepID=X0K857_FUSO5|nr:uncharacterized protein FOIG_00006 [Fusarium odoratissimum NRRL 54006]EXM09653.1 hypothetical protein FOIG_00006 [Fusarium odoratissimum NRRL 54006]KAK2137867.1 hypothetical protein NOF04DRAFT_6 [Fusarium oxysporum II5]